MQISVTERGTFRRCRRQWAFASFNKAGMEPVMVKPALALGGLVHKTLETWFDNVDTSAEDIFMDLSTKRLAEIAKEYQERVHAAMSLVEYTQYNELVALGASMMKNYQTRYGNPLPEGFELISPEQKMVVPIPNTDHEEVDKTTGEIIVVPHYLEGTFDGLIKRKADGAIFVLEHKTYEQRPKEEVLKTNDQFLAYIWLASQLNIGKVVGLAYDGMWKRSNPPRGRTFEDLFCRVLTMRPDEELAEFQENVRLEVLEMANPDTALYPNRQWMGCWDCAFEKVCTSMSRGEDWRYLMERYYKPRDNNNDDGQEEVA